MFAALASGNPEADEAYQNLVIPANGGIQHYGRIT